MSAGPKIKSEEDVVDTGGKRHRPLIPLVLGFAAGIVLDAWLGWPTVVWLLLAAVCLICGLVSVWRNWGGRTGNWLMAGLLMVLLGAGWHGYRCGTNLDPRLATLLKKQPGKKKNYRTVRARVRRDPELFLWKRPFGNQPRQLWRCDVDLAAVKTGPGQWTRVGGGITVFGKFPAPRITSGDLVEFPAEFSPNRGPTNPGETNFRAIYRRRGNYGRASVQAGEAVKVVERPAWYSSPEVFLSRLRGRVKERLVWDARGQFTPLTTALMLGERGGFTRSEWRLMAEAGTIHFLAISGLHVGLFAGVVWLLLRWMKFPFRWRPLLLIGAVWGYVVFMGSPVSARRAGLMVTIVAAAPLLRRRRDSVSAVLAAALIILIAHPGELFSVGFQFTFTAVWALLFLYPQIERIVWPWRSVIDRLQQPSQRLFSEDVQDLAGRYIALSLCVCIALAPLTVYHFNRFSLLTPIINLVIWPLALVLIGVSFVMIPVSLLLPWLVSPMLSGTSWLAGCIQLVLQLFSRLPGFVIYTPSPPAWWIVGCYGIIALWVWRRAIPRGRRLFLTGVAGLICAYAAIGAVSGKPDAMEVCLTDVGHGQCMTFQLPDGRTAVYDAGSSSTSRAEVAGGVLWRRRVRRIGALLISHRDSDHCNFVPYLARRFEIDNLLLPPMQAGVAAGAIEKTLTGVSATRSVLTDGVEVMGGGLETVCLHPDRMFLSRTGVDDNNCSAVMRCSYRGWDILLTGDIGGPAIRHLTEHHGQNLGADVVILPHHGAWAEGLGNFLRLVDPRVVLVSTDSQLPARTARVLNGLGLSVWSTQREGAVTLRINREEIRIEGYKSGRTTQVRQ